jgi:hypothetical protein
VKHVKGTGAKSKQESYSFQKNVEKDYQKALLAFSCSYSTPSQVVVLRTCHKDAPRAFAEIRIPNNSYSMNFANLPQSVVFPTKSLVVAG